MSSRTKGKLRILFVTDRSAPSTGGVQTYLHHVSRGLAERHDVTVLAQRIDDGPSHRLNGGLKPPPMFAPFDQDGVRVAPLRFTSAQRLRMAPTIGLVLPGMRRYAYGPMRLPVAQSYARVASPVIAQSAREADVVHVWASGFLALATLRAARAVGRPVLITPFAHRGQWGNDRVSMLAYGQADRVVGLLEEDCNHLRELGVPPERVTECPVCSPGVERGQGAAWRRRHQVDGPLIAFLGVRRAYKGFDILIDALPQLASTVPSATVVFAGPGEPIEQRQPLRVIDRGRISDAERAGILEAADILCLPSAGEIYPLSILEAWSAETAVLTSDIPPLAELMARSNGGLAVPRDPASVASGIAALLSGPQHEMAASGHRYWRAHATVSAVVDRHLDLYYDLLSVPSPEAVEARAGHGYPDPTVH